MLFFNYFDLSICLLIANIENYTMTDILSVVEKTMAESENPDLLKKGKKGKKSKNNKIMKNKKLREFEDLESFQNFLKMESLDDYDNEVHATLNYYPPFVLQSCHNDPEKIKISMNKNNKKFVRHLSQHVNRHLMHDIVEQENSSVFKEPSHLRNVDKIDAFDKLLWLYEDENDHVSTSGHKFKVKMDVECHNEDAKVSVHYDAVPYM